MGALRSFNVTPPNREPDIVETIMKSQGEQMKLGSNATAHGWSTSFDGFEHRAPDAEQMVGMLMVVEHQACELVSQGSLAADQVMVIQGNLAADQVLMV